MGQRGRKQRDWTRIGGRLEAGQSGGAGGAGGAIFNSPNARRLRRLRGGARRIIRGEGHADFGQLEGGPSALPDRRDIRGNHRQFAGSTHPHDVLGVEVVGEHSGHRIVERVVSIIRQPVVPEADRRESERSHQGGHFLATHRGPVGVDGHVGLGDDRAQFAAPRPQRKSLQPVRGLREQHGVQPHPLELIPEGGAVDAAIQALPPAIGGFIKVHVVFSSTEPALTGPRGLEGGVLQEMAPGFRPVPQVPAARGVALPQPA